MEWSDAWSARDKRADLLLSQRPLAGLGYGFAGPSCKRILEMSAIRDDEDSWHYQRFQYWHGAISRVALEISRWH